MRTTLLLAISPCMLKAATGWLMRAALLSMLKELFLDGKKVSLLY